MRCSPCPSVAPKFGIMQQKPCGSSPRGAIFSMYTATTSPFSAPSIMIGPFCGFRNGTCSTCDGLSVSSLILPSNASRVSTTTRSPGFDVQHRLRIRADRVVIRLLHLLGEMVLHRFPIRADTALHHDRFFKPFHVPLSVTVPGTGESVASSPSCSRLNVIDDTALVHHAAAMSRSARPCPCPARPARHRSLSSRAICCSVSPIRSTIDG